MKNLHIKILLVCLFSVLIISTVHCNILSQGERDAYPDRTTSKGMIYTAINVGRIIGNVVFTLDDDVTVSKAANSIRRISPGYSRYSVNDRMAIAFGIVALIFLIMNMYFGGKIVEFLRSRGRKAHFYAIRWMIFSYVNQYKSITIGEDGRVGPYYRPISVSAVLFIIFILIAIIFAVVS